MPGAAVSSRHAVPNVCAAQLAMLVEPGLHFIAQDIVSDVFSLRERAGGCVVPGGRSPPVATLAEEYAMLYPPCEPGHRRGRCFLKLLWPSVTLATQETSSWTLLSSSVSWGCVVSLVPLPDASTHRRTRA